MKFIPSSSDHENSSDLGLKLGIVRLGRAAGKVKYSLLDERDIVLVQRYVFEARVEVDRNGGGAAIYAWCFDAVEGRHSGLYVHKLIWERHCGGVADGWRVAHKNAITVDNRLDNLHLVPCGGATSGAGRRRRRRSFSRALSPHCHGRETEDGGDAHKTDGCTQILSHEHDQQQQYRSIYWRAMEQLPADATEHLPVCCPLSGVVDINGDPLHADSSSSAATVAAPHPAARPIYLGGCAWIDECVYYECRNPPCTRIETDVREFSICGRCQMARYCGTVCQQMDWPSHKRVCRERPRLVSCTRSERTPER